jgi:hypothetical protein
MKVCYKDFYSRTLRYTLIFHCILLYLLIIIALFTVDTLALLDFHDQIH